MPQPPASTPTSKIEEPGASDTLRRVELRFDVSAVLGSLNPRQRQICDLLGQEGQKIKEASEILHTPRGTLYGEIRRIRRIFLKEGLEKYLG